MPIGVVGLGELGTILLRGLGDAGYATLGYDRLRRTAPECDVAGSVAEVGRQCDTVLVAVATDDQTREVAAELLTAMPSGSIVLHATVNPQTPRDIAASASPRVLVVDAPVSIHHDGRPRPCVAFLGSDSPVPLATRRVLGTYCREVIPAGRLGAGQVVKLANNVMSLVNTAASAEALRLAAAYGIDAELVRSLALKGSGASHALATWPHRAALLDPDREEARRRALAVKDLDVALRLGAGLGVELPLTRATVDRLRSLVAGAE